MRRVVCGVWSMDIVITNTDGYECWKSTRFDLVLVVAMQMIDGEERHLVENGSADIYSLRSCVLKTLIQRTG